MNLLSFQARVLTLIAFMALIACQPNDSKLLSSEKEASASLDSLNMAKAEIQQTLGDLQKGQSAYVLVNNLRLRKNHDLESNVTAMLNEGEEVIYLGEVSKNQEEIELRGEKKRAPFYKVKTKNGKIGWIYGGALSFEKIPEKNYQAVIAFVKNTQDLNPESIADWSYYSSEALDLARKSGILTSFADEAFDKVLIKDKEGTILDQVSIMRFAQKHKWGLVCVEKGQHLHFIPFDPGMAEAVATYFKIEED